MSLLVVGSVAYDTVETPAGKRDDSLGGSAMYFSIASSYFTSVSLVAVVGEDFSQKDVALLESRNIDTTGLERREGKTFRWSGVYSTEDVNIRDTLDTQLNVFADFSPKLDSNQRESSYLFLANIDPTLQLDVLNQMSTRPKVVALDTMNFWIDGAIEALKRVVEAVDILFMDEGEARTFSGETNLVKAGKAILGMGPHTAIIKRGEHGVLLFRDGTVFAAPAFPLENVVDPTGAGDSFGGGFMGYLAATGDLSDDGFRRATILGSTMGSFTVEKFSADRLASLSAGDIDERFRAFTQLSQFSPLQRDESLPWMDGGSPAS